MLVVPARHILAWFVSVKTQPEPLGFIIGTCSTMAVSHILPIDGIRWRWIWWLHGTKPGPGGYAVATRTSKRKTALPF
jgi:hypothetical protein